MNLERRLLVSFDTTGRAEEILKRFELAEPREVYRAMRDVVQGQRAAP